MDWLVWYFWGISVVFAILAMAFLVLLAISKDKPWKEPSGAGSGFLCFWFLNLGATVAAICISQRSLRTRLETINRLDDFLGLKAVSGGKGWIAILMSEILFFWAGAGSLSLAFNKRSRSKADKGIVTTKQGERISAPMPLVPEIHPAYRGNIEQAEIVETRAKNEDETVTEAALDAASETRQADRESATKSTIEAARENGGRALSMQSHETAPSKKENSREIWCDWCGGEVDTEPIEDRSADDVAAVSGVENTAELDKRKAKYDSRLIAINVRNNDVKAHDQTTRKTDLESAKEGGETRVAISLGEVKRGEGIVVCGRCVAKAAVLKARESKLEKFDPEDVETKTLAAFSNHNNLNNSSEVEIEADADNAWSQKGEPSGRSTAMDSLPDTSDHEENDKSEGSRASPCGAGYEGDDDFGAESSQIGSPDEESQNEEMEGLQYHHRSLRIEAESTDGAETSLEYYRVFNGRGRFRTPSGAIFDVVKK